ncbi:MAG: cob/CoM heterodisulfide reductase subunit C [Promethearchaeota archaeon CR_4]|nr:MAG: cob/CoM heterodisulfide reductase subunit C [Candidatus Lokiarchaeota archaeon CR_4]
MPQHKELAQTLIETGHGVPINGVTQKLRESLGLSRNPPNVHSCPDALREIRTLIHSTGFEDLVGDKPENSKFKLGIIEYISETEQDQEMETNYE